MIRASYIVTRMQSDARTNALLKEIAEGADMPSLVDQLATAPAAYVGEGFEERAQPNKTATMVVEQATTAYFAVLLVFNEIGPTGSAQDDAIIDCREAVKDVLIGWAPEGGNDNPLIYAGSKTLGIDTDAGVLIYACNFSNNYTIKKVRT